jgi:hypothetical protein
MNYLAKLALSHDSPDLCLLSSQDYRREPPAPGPSHILDSQEPTLEEGGSLGTIGQGDGMLFGHAS